jgi:DNA-binding NarL/FixJ family response regulator
MFTDAVRRVADGGSALDPDVVARLVGRKQKASLIDSLTPREREVLTLIAEGRPMAASRTNWWSRWPPWNGT